MMSVEIKINNTLIYRATARRISPAKPKKKDVCIYIVNENTGREFTHKHVYQDGALVLGQFLYNNLVEI